MFDFLKNQVELDGGTLISHAVGLVMLFAASPAGQEMITASPYAPMIAVVLAYLGGARAGQPAQPPKK